MANAKIVIKKNQGTSRRLFVSFMRQYHLLVFFVFVVGCLSAAVIMINKTLTDTSSQEYTPTNNPGTIDEATLERLRSHHSSTEAPAPEALPEGRINPFTE